MATKTIAIEEAGDLSYYPIDIEELKQCILDDGETFVSLSRDGVLRTVAPWLKFYGYKYSIYQARNTGTGTNNYDFGGNPLVTYEFCSYSKKRKGKSIDHTK